MIKNRPSRFLSKDKSPFLRRLEKLWGSKRPIRLLFLEEKGRVILYPIRGNILDVHGTIEQRKPLDFKNLRQKTKEEVSKRIVGEVE